MDLGNTYQTDTKCSEFTKSTAEHMKDNTLSELSKSDYFTILIDGATDTAVIENELIYTNLHSVFHEKGIQGGI